MSLFKSDLTRNFAIGFAIGALCIFLQTGPEMWSEVVPQAVAATIH